MGQPKKYTDSELLEKLKNYIYHQINQGKTPKEIVISELTLSKEPEYSDLAYLPKLSHYFGSHTAFINWAKEKFFRAGDEIAFETCRNSKGLETLVQESNEFHLTKNLAPKLGISQRQLFFLLKERLDSGFFDYFFIKDDPKKGKRTIIVPQEVVSSLKNRGEDKINRTRFGPLLDFLILYQERQRKSLIINGITIRYDPLKDFYFDVYYLVLKPRVEKEGLESKMDDKLLLRARLGDKDAAGWIVKQLEDSVVRPASKTIWNPQAFKTTKSDLRQIAREAVFNAIRNYDWRGPFEPYAMVCAQNEVRGVYTKSKTRGRNGYEIPLINSSDEGEFRINPEIAKSEQLFCSANQTEITLRDQTKRIFWSEFEILLTKEEKRIFALREEGKNPKEIGKIYGVSRTTIQNRIITAFGKLRESPKLLRLYEELSS